MSEIIPVHPAIPTADDLAQANFETLRRAGRKASTIHQYRQTEQQFFAFCDAQGIPYPNAFEVVYIDRFFQSICTRYSRVTLMNKLSHLRKALEALAASSDQTAALFLRQLQALKAYRIDATWGGTNTRKRAGKRLPVKAVYAALNAEASTDLAQERNTALYALLFFAGLRRAELRLLKWAQVDFDRSVICVVGGKKRAADEADEIPMLGELKAILARWQSVQRQAAEGAAREYVISAVRRGGHLGADKPLASGAVYELMAAIDAIPHDARHTLVSHLLEKGVPVHTAQKIARHRRPETTLAYAHALEAEQLAKTVPNPYG